MELMNRIRKSRKGFTLVEIIVVLVILAILAAFTIPAMLGFVNDAKGKAYIAEAREVYVAAQATATEIIAGNDGTTGDTGDITDADLSLAISSALVAGQTTLPSNPTTKQKASYQMNKYLATAQDGDLTILDAPAASGGAAWTVVVGANDTAETGKVKSLIYIRNGYQVTIEGGKSTVQKWVAAADDDE